MFVRVMNLMMNTALGRQPAGDVAAPRPQAATRPRGAVRARPTPAETAVRPSGLATYQIYARAFDTAARGR